MNISTSGFNKDQILRAYRFNLGYAKDIVDDVSDQQLYQSPGPGLENHPGFVLGHLAIASGLIAKHLGETYAIPFGWGEFFHRTGPGDPRLPLYDSADLPIKSSLIRELERQHELVESRIHQADRKQIETPVEWRFDKYFPTVGDMLVFMCITHEAMHLAQVAAWRRAFGLESSLARL